MLCLNVPVPVHPLVIILQAQSIDISLFNVQFVGYVKPLSLAIIMLVQHQSYRYQVKNLFGEFSFSVST
jgi:hypothetical protein